MQEDARLLEHVCERKTRLVPVSCCAEQGSGTLFCEGQVSGHVQLCRKYSPARPPPFVTMLSSPRRAKAAGRSWNQWTWSLLAGVCWVLCVNDLWVGKIPWRKERLLTPIFWRVELYFFSLECNEVSSNEL